MLLLFTTTKIKKIGNRSLTRKIKVETKTRRIAKHFATRATEEVVNRK